MLAISGGAFAPIPGLAGTAVAAPSGVEQAKKLYGEAMAAMEKKDYATAVAKFEGAYQFAPDKHAFNYNIASAAELAGDCRKAQSRYKMFLDLVPKHEARASATKTLEKLAKSCIHDDETEKVVSAEERSNRDEQRSVDDGERAMQEALAETRYSARFYAGVAAMHGDKQPFKRLAKVKAKQAAKIEKLIARYSLKGKPREPDELAVPDSIDQACKRGVSQEARNATVYDKVFELFEERDIIRTMDRFARKAELRHMVTFRDNCPQ